MGALTIVSNIYGNPAMSIPAGTIDGLLAGRSAATTRTRSSSPPNAGTRDREPGEA